ncbi:MAG: hypothetical protein KC484_06865 [Colwelliaceae bacterium]|nr:hypothetical protein [Colwelliaceae bacterium]
MRNATKLFIIAFCFFITKASYANNIIINKALSDADARYDYTHYLLNLIIEATPEFGEIKIETAKSYMTRDRALRELVLAKNINVMAEAPKKLWDEKLLVVPVPIRKGIQGLRVFIIRNESQGVMKNIKSLKDLIKIPTGSGALWSTRQVMEDAGFNVVTGSNYQGLFTMLTKGRFDTFSRGINEAYQEVGLQNKLYPQLVVDENILLKIPLATYFYVSPSKPELAKRIETGMLRIIKNGSFDKFFYQNHCDDLLRSHIGKRKVFSISNSLVSTERMLSLVDDSFLLNTNANFESVCQKYH